MGQLGVGRYEVVVDGEYDAGWVFGGRVLRRFAVETSAKRYVRAAKSQGFLNRVAVPDLRVRDNLTMEQR